MKTFGVLSAPYKYARAVADGAGLRADDKISSRNYLWPIEGEQVSIKQICERFPHINPKTIRYRINNGDRTWEKLGRAPSQKSEKKTAAFKNMIRKRKLMAQAEFEKREYYRRKTAGNAKL